jgi:hypothetical protein
MKGFEMKRVEMKGFDVKFRHGLGAKHLWGKSPYI